MDQPMNNGIRQWFQEYAEAISRFDADRVSLQYADCYVEAGPKGSLCIRNDDEFRRGIARKREVFKSMGFKAAKALSVEDSRLDQNYSMVKVHWQMQFENKPGERVDAEFDNTYFVRHRGYDSKVVCYIAQEDEESMMRRLGLVATQKE